MRQVAPRLASKPSMEETFSLPRPHLPGPTEAHRTASEHPLLLPCKPTKRIERLSPLELPALTNSHTGTRAALTVACIRWRCLFVAHFNWEKSVLYLQIINIHHLLPIQASKPLGDSITKTPKSHGASVCIQCTTRHTPFCLPEPFLTPLSLAAS